MFNSLASASPSQVVARIQALDVAREAQGQALFTLKLRAGRAWSGAGYSEDALTAKVSAAYRALIRANAR